MRFSAIISAPAEIATNTLTSNVIFPVSLESKGSRVVLLFYMSLLQLVWPLF